MDEQDEGRIDPDETEETRQLGGVSEFARECEETAAAFAPGRHVEKQRLDAERAALIAQGVPEDALLKTINLDGDDEDCSTPLEFDEMDEPGEVLEMEGQGEVLSVDGESVPFVPNILVELGSREVRTSSSKLRLDLVPPEVSEFFARVAAYGTTKYDDWNWLKGLKQSETYGCAQRHLQAWFAGEDKDETRMDDLGGLVEGSKLPHLWHALWNVAVLAYFERHRPDLDDRLRPDEIQAGYRLPLEVVGNRDGETFTIEVQLPNNDTPDGMRWFQQGGDRPTLEQARAVALALRDDGYDLRVIRVKRTRERIEVYAGGDRISNGTIVDTVFTLFPGDPVDTDDGVRKAEWLASQELAAQEQASQDEAAGIEYDGDGEVVPS